jgi:hypothetical protein
MHRACKNNTPFNPDQRGWKEIEVPVESQWYQQLTLPFQDPKKIQVSS